MRRGYIALSSILVLGVVIVAVSTAVSLNSVSNLQSTASESDGTKLHGIVEACAEEALLQLNKNNSVSSSIVLPQGSCTVTVNSHVGTVWTLSIQTTSGSFTRSVQITANRSSNVSITSWQEI